jgi:hypothetical protein
MSRKIWSLKVYQSLIKSIPLLRAWTILITFLNCQMMLFKPQMLPRRPNSAKSKLCRDNITNNKTIQLKEMFHFPQARLLCPTRMSMVLSYLTSGRKELLFKEARGLFTTIKSKMFKIKDLCKDLRDKVKKIYKRDKIMRAIILPLKIIILSRNLITVLTLLILLNHLLDRLETKICKKLILDNKLLIRINYQMIR